MADWTDDRTLPIRYQVVSPYFQDRYVPEYRTEGAAGMDLHACLTEPITITSLGRVRVPTGIAIEISSRSVVGLVYARSGLAWKHGIGLPNGVGVIDSDYIGEIEVLLTNFSTEEFVIQPGDRIAQIVFAPIHVALLTRADELHSTERGTGGFGSTGVQVDR